MFFWRGCRPRKPPPQTWGLHQRKPPRENHIKTRPSKHIKKTSWYKSEAFFDYVSICLDTRKYYVVHWIWSMYSNPQWGNGASWNQLISKTIESNWALALTVGMSMIGTASNKDLWKMKKAHHALRATIPTKSKLTSIASFMLQTFSLIFGDNKTHIRR